jgi:hypothetical protein
VASTALASARLADLHPAALLQVEALDRQPVSVSPSSFGARAQAVLDVATCPLGADGAAVLTDEAMTVVPRQEPSKTERGLSMLKKIFRHNGKIRA